MEAKQVFGNDVTDTAKKQFIEILKYFGFGSGTVGKKAGNMAGNIVKATFSSTSSQTVPHGLGHVPTICFPVLPVDKAGAVLQLVGKDSTSLTLACNVAGATFILYVE